MCNAWWLIRDDFHEYEISENEISLLHKLQNLLGNAGAYEDTGLENISSIRLIINENLEGFIRIFKVFLKANIDVGYFFPLNQKIINRGAFIKVGLEVMDLSINFDYSNIDHLDKSKLSCLFIETAILLLPKNSFLEGKKSEDYKQARKLYRSALVKHSQLLRHYLDIDYLNDESRLLLEVKALLSASGRKLPPLWRLDDFIDNKKWGAINLANNNVVRIQNFNRL